MDCCAWIRVLRWASGSGDWLVCFCGSHWLSRPFDATRLRFSSRLPVQTTRSLSIRSTSTCTSTSYPRTRAYHSTQNHLQSPSPPFSTTMYSQGGIPTMERVLYTERTSRPFVSFRGLAIDLSAACIFIGMSFAME